MINIKSKNFSLNEIKGVIFDKDGTITDSNIYWSKIITMRTEEILKAFKISDQFSYEISKSMGLDLNTNKLLPEGPIALKSRREVINNVLILLNKINDNNISYKNIDDIFVRVHNQFTLIVDKYMANKSLS